MDDLHHELARLGFSSKEAAVYLAALQLGKAGVYSIARLAKVNRATTYSVLDSLSARGLITASIEDGERRFAAESPEGILTIFELQRRELELRIRSAEQTVSRLRTFHNQNLVKPKIRYIENLEGLRQMQQEYETIDHEIIQIVGYETFMKLYGSDANDDHQQELAKRKRKIRSIFLTDNPVSCPTDLNIEFVTISPSLFSAEGEMSVCGDRLVLFSYSSGIIAIEIISKPIADTARATLELAWKQAQVWALQKSIKE